MNMNTVFQTLIFLHAFAGLLGLIVFWWPALNRKGSTNHKKLGAVFAQAMLVAGISGFVMVVLMYAAPLAIRSAETVANMSVEQSQAFIASTYSTANLLLMLAALLIANTRQAVLTLQHKQHRKALRTVVHGLCVGLLGATSLYLLWLAANGGSTLYWVFSILGLSNTYSILRYNFKAEILPREWLLQHISNICAAGIGAHTAFFVFGGRSFLEQYISGNYSILLWIAPGVIGGVAITLSSRHFAKKYRIFPIDMTPDQSSSGRAG